MATKSIDERAKEYAKGEGINNAIGGWEDMADAYIAGATEQDCIARQEERERCIKAAQDFHCSGCGFSEDCTIDSDEVGHCIYMQNDKCMDRVKIRKSIEEGGEG